MKIIGRFKKLNSLLPLYIISGLLCLAVPFRTYQLLFITENTTGFYKNVDWSVYAIYGLSTLAILVSIVIVNLAKNVPSSRDEIKKKNIFLSISSILFSFGIIIDSVLSFASIIAGTAGTENFTSVVIETVFGVLAAIYFMLFGISHFDGRTTYFQYRFLALAPLAWTTGRIIIRFMKKIAYVNVADLMLELFVLAGMMIFFLSLARISSGLSNEKSMRSLFASGYICIFFCALANVPRIVLMLTGNSDYIPMEYPLSVCDLTFALFVTAYIVNAMNTATVNDHNEIYTKES
ncbi:MAG: hypothetical protein IJB72_01165 [Clostridia bacterium]|nr:hypothetical protein [Clostridia bacterium]